MRTFMFYALFEAGDRKGVTVVTFPDVPEAITEGRGEAEARAMAEDALGLALLSYPERGLPLPKPKAGPKRGRRMEPITVAPEVAGKLAVLDAFAEAKISKSELARRLRKDEKEVRRLLDPKHATKLQPLSDALRALGKRLVIGVDDIAA
jgi:antitoxin HicB